MTDCPNPVAEKAALAEALRATIQCFGLAAWVVHAQRFPNADRREVKAIQQVQRVLADLSPAAKEILEKAQAHDAMVAALRIIEERTAHLPGWAATDSAADVFLSELWAVAHKALAGKEPE